MASRRPNRVADIQKILEEDSDSDLSDNYDDSDDSEPEDSDCASPPPPLFSCGMAESDDDHIDKAGELMDVDNSKDSTWLISKNNEEVWSTLPVTVGGRLKTQNVLKEVEGRYVNFLFP